MPVRRIIDGLNALRNAIAHSFFPENRYEYRRHKKVIYAEKAIRTIDGFRSFQEDCQKAVNYLIQRLRGIDLSEE